MKKTLIALAVLFLGCATVSQTKINAVNAASFATCPDPCPGQCVPQKDYCLVIKADGTPKRMNAEGQEVDVPEADKQRLVGCCVENETGGGYHKEIRWPKVTDGVPAECIQLATPGKFPNVSMTGVDLGHALKLNQICCGRNEGPVIPGHWGACPRCSFQCNPAGLAIPDPDGCEAFCATE